MKLFLSNIKSGKLSGNSRKYNKTKQTATDGATDGARSRAASSSTSAAAGAETAGAQTAATAAASTAASTAATTASAGSSSTKRSVTRLSARKSTSGSARASAATSVSSDRSSSSASTSAARSTGSSGTARGRSTAPKSTTSRASGTSRAGSRSSSGKSSSTSSSRNASICSGSSDGGSRSGGLLGAWRGSRVKGDEAAAGMARQDLQLKTFNSSIVTAAMFFALAGITLTTTGAYVYRSMQSNMVPYVVTVDTHGVVRSQGPVAPLSASSLPEEVITSQLCGFISDARLISKDKEVQREAVSHVFALLRKGSDVYRQLHQHYSQNNPMANTRSRSVRVEIANVIARGGSSYQIDWTEKSTDSDGIALPDRKMRAIITYELGRGESKDPSMVMLNPLNLYITEYTVSPVLA